jgi:hypothetical protein
VRYLQTGIIVIAGLVLVLGVLVFQISVQNEAPSTAPAPEPVGGAPEKEETGSAGGTLPPERQNLALKRLDRRLSQLARSNLAFDAPRQMQLGETETIRLTLSPSASTGELTQRLIEAGAKGRIESAQQIITANRMQARLTGQDFEIEATSPETQAVTFAEATDWSWDVEPTEGGEDKKLHLTVTALIPIEGETTPRQIRSFDQTITVNVTLGQRVGGVMDKHAGWIVPAILVPLAGAAYAWWRRRRSSGGTSSPPPPINRRQPPTGGTS